MTSSIVSQINLTRSHRTFSIRHTCVVGRLATLVLQQARKPDRAEAVLPKNRIADGTSCTVQILDDLTKEIELEKQDVYSQNA